MGSARDLMRRAAGAYPVVAVLACSTTVAQTISALQRMDRDHLCVTNGTVVSLAGGRLAVETPSSRAVLQADSENAADQVAEIRFQYLGPSRDSRPLASGELRRQIGLKLRAQDGCNLVYAMWHIEPDAKVAISIKRNPGLHASRQCGAGGYVDFPSQARGNLTPIHSGEAHVLRAELRGKDLTVTADGAIAGQGALGDAALPIGPPGFRTDNARFAFEFLTAPPTGSHAVAQSAQRRCATVEGD